MTKTSETENSKIIEISNVSYSYDSTANVLNDISINIDKGEIVAFVGESGSGKSTLLHIISGYIKPNSGSATILGKSITKPTEDCAVMFQDDFLYPWLTVEKNIKLGLKITGKKVSNDYINNLIEIVGLKELINKKPNQLSGGQRQRVAFARSLATSPEILALDEPFSALDPYTTSRLQILVRKTILQMNKSLLLVSHSIEEVVKMADRVFILKDGSLGESVDIVLTHEQRQDTNVTKQYEEKINELLNSNKKEKQDVHTLYYI